MDVYSKSFFKWMTLFGAMVVAVALALPLGVGQIALFFVVAYFSAVTLPARLFVATERRLPKIGELLTLTLIWSVITAFAVGTLVLGLMLGGGRPLALGVIVQLMVMMIFGLGFVGVLSFLINGAFYLRGIK